MATIDQIVAKLRRQQSEQARQRRQRWAEVCSLWEQCYAAEGHDPAALVVTFSQNNPYLATYAEALASYAGHDLSQLRARSSA